MIRIEQFLFEYNVERTQAESLIERFRNLTFATNQEFVDYFTSQNITLGFENKVGVAKTTFQQKDELLQKFKDFKSSTDYDYVKKYIAEQRRIQAAIDSGNIQNSSNLLDGITSQPVDPFFNFIVRKMLTGSETGVLPSESLRSLLDELTKKTKQDIDTTVAVSRDELGRVISFDNYLRNKGSLRVDLLDERFTIETFNYVVNKGFNQLQDAIDAEQNVLRKANEFGTLLSSDSTGDGIVDDKDLIENLKKLIIEDSNSVPALQSRLQSLESDLGNLNSLVSLKDENIGDLNRIIEELSIQRNLIVDQGAIKDETIIALNEVIDATLAELEDKVSQQLTNTTDAFDALSTQIESQAKKSEEAAAKQLAAFEKAVGGIADALKPVEPEPDPENPAAEIIKQIFAEWDKIYIIPNSKYNNISNIFKNLEVKSPPTRLDYVLVDAPPPNSNSFGSGQEINQILKWNDTFKSQFKTLVSSITDKTKATAVLADAKVLASNTGGIQELRDVIRNVFDEWSRDIGGSLGVGRSIINKAVLELDPSYKIVSDSATKTYAQNFIRNVNDPELLLRIVRILSEINNVVDKSGSWLKIG
jgi:hypothetical protein